MVNFKWDQKRALEEVRKIAKDNGLAFLQSATANNNCIKNQEA